VELDEYRETIKGTTVVPDAGKKLIQRMAKKTGVRPA